MTSGSNPVAEPATRGPSSPPTRADFPLVRGVARLPWKVRTKLLVGFAGIVALFVLVAALGLRALGQSDARVESLGTLQLRTSAYRELETASAQLRQLLALRAGGIGWNLYLGRRASFEQSRRTLALLDQTIAATLSQLGPATDEARFGFEPSAEDERALVEIRRDHGRLSSVLGEIRSYDADGEFAKARRLQHRTAEPLANQLVLLSDQLSGATRAEAIALIDQNRSAYTDSRNLVVAVGAASVVLALLLGYVLARSVVAPIQQTGKRLDEIASGDFSEHLDVPNRDELGALAANVNKMNDELGRLYEQLESQASELAGWNRTLEARVDEQVKELRASRTRVVLAADAERRRIERNLHDGAQQHLIGLAIQLRLARDLADSHPAKAKELLGALDDEVQATLDQVRDLAHGIYPPLLQDRGLPDALAAAALRAPIGTRVDAQGLGRYPPDVEATVYFCCLEALQNAAKHAGEGATVTVRVRASEGSLSFDVADDGSGFDAVNGRAGVGMTNMRDRVGALGGSLRVDSEQGTGTTVSGTIPLEG